MLRELEKAAAAFAPVDDVALRQWPVIATGNWGCGAFAPGIGTGGTGPGDFTWDGWGISHWDFFIYFLFGPIFSKMKFY